MQHDYILWPGVTAYALHVIEEYVYDWKNWANRQLHLPVGWKLPAFSLIYPALMLINTLFFHILPTIMGRKFSPGLITALALFIPTSLFIYAEAANDGVLTIGVLLLSIVGGAIAMAYPIILLKTKHLSFLNQEEVPAVH